MGSMPREPGGSHYVILHIICVTLGRLLKPSQFPVPHLLIADSDIATLCSVVRFELSDTGKLLSPTADADQLLNELINCGLLFML